MPARYATVEAVRDVLAPNPTGDPASAARVASTAASLDDATIADQIGEAASRVDSYIGTRYVVPVTSVPDMVVFWTRDVAAWLCMLVHRRNAPVEQNDPVRLRYEAALTELRAVRDGKATIPADRLADGTMLTGYAEVVNPYEGALFLPEDVISRTGAESFLDRRDYLWWLNW